MLEQKKQLVHEVSRQTSPEARGRSLRVVLGDRKDVADSVRQEQEARQQKLERASRDPSPGKRNAMARAEAQQSVERSVDGLRCADTSNKCTLR